MSAGERGGPGARALALGAAAAGGALVLASAAGTWVRLRPDAPGLPSLAQEVGPPAGTSVLGWLGIAGVLALLAAPGVLRRAVGAVLVPVGLLVLVRAWAGPDLDAAASAPALAVGAEHVVDRVVVWPALSALGGLLLVLAGLLALVRGGGWSGMGARYERGDAPARRSPHLPDDGARGTWDSLDAGRDPTL